MKKLKSGILLPISVMLFIMLVLTFPLVIFGSYAGRSESPEHILTYDDYKLTWDTGTNVNSDGVAELSLFDDKYQNVKADNADKVLAPGTSTGGDSIVRLKNDDKVSLTYTALVYYDKSSEDLPITVDLANDAGSDTSSYVLPGDISDAQVARAVTGKLEAGQIQDFDLKWSWEYEDSRIQDVLDTALGDKAADGEAGDVTAGIYIYVQLDTEPDTEEPTTELPSTEEPTTVEPDTELPSTAEPVSTEEPTTIEPDTELPSTAEPVSTEEPTTVEPDTELPSTAEPVSTEEPTTQNPSGPKNPENIITPSPKTGDDSMVTGYFVLLCMSGAMVIILAITRRRCRRDEEE